MSIPVKIDDLATALEDFDTAYLLTVGDGHVKVVCVVAEVDGRSVRIPTGSKGTARNLEQNPAVTLMCPPREVKGMTLIVDGTAEPDGEGFRMTPTGAILHRPAAHADGAVTTDGCGNDCQHL